MKFQTPRGTRDFLPEDMLKRHFILDIARNVFEKWGFDPVETPAFEDYSLLTAKSGEAVKDEIYYFKDKSDRELGLRFDFTVPLSRIMVNNPSIPKPFRRYQIGPVWRYDRPGSGRYREFWQADIDVVGAAGVDADIEVVMCACSTLRKIGISNFYVRVSNRKIINSLLRYLDVGNDVFRTIDKLEKIGETAVREELASKGIQKRKADLIMNFIQSDLKSNEKMLDADGMEGVKEMKKLVDTLNSRGFSARADMSLVRGLDYYTGNVFEVMQEGSNLSITAGGRYDSIINSLGGNSTPAVGISLGVDRLTSLIQLDFGKTKTSVYVANVDKKSAEKAGEIASQLREIGVNTEYDLMKRPLSKQLEYVNSKGIRFVMVIGQKEMQKGTAKLRNMENGSEKDVELRNLRRVFDVVNSA